MLKLSLSFILLTLSLQAAPTMVQKCYSSEDCKACHLPIVNQWKSSYHARSHYDKNEYLQASMNYVHRKTRKSLNSVKVQCATCHNPRISVTETSEDYEIAAVMKLTRDSDVDKAVDSAAISEGINCLVCHNVDAINETLPPEKRGIHRLKWNPAGMMSGPFKDAKSTYHNSQYREFFGKDPKKLCLTCHANDRSEKGLVFANTQNEYKDTKKQCADCHMGPKKPGYASTLAVDNGKPKKRMVREHWFVGAHYTPMWKDALSVNATQKGEKLIIKLSNKNPHNIPTGFGAREIVVEISYWNDGQLLEEQELSLTQHYTDKRGKITIPHLAVKVTENFSIPANGYKKFLVKIPKSATNAVVKVSYRLVNEEVRTLLKLKGKEWGKKSFIAKSNITLR